MKFLSRTFLITLLSIGLSSCGGGGGGPDASGSSAQAISDIQLSASPRAIDTGEHILVRIALSGIDREGIYLKVRYPSSLSIVPDKTVMETEQRGRGPYRDAREYVLDESSILVFDLPYTFVENIREATFEFRLRGLYPIKDGELEVDVDVHEYQGFSPTDPRFTPILGTSFQVFG
jgi:hypothetical protein